MESCKVPLKSEMFVLKSSVNKHLKSLRIFMNFHEISLVVLQIVVFNSPDKVTELAGYKEMYNYLCEAVTWCRVSSV